LKPQLSNQEMGKKDQSYKEWNKKRAGDGTHRLKGRGKVELLPAPKKDKTEKRKRGKERGFVMLFV